MCDASVLPTYLGGTCECEGGCVPETDPDAGMATVPVAAGDQVVMEKEVSAGNGASWEFRTLKKDIGFEVRIACACSHGCARAQCGSGVQQTQGPLTLTRVS